MAGPELMALCLGMEQMVAVAVVAEHREEFEVLDYNRLRHRAGLEIMVGLVAAVLGLLVEVAVPVELVLVQMAV
jgi:hypothetical protein